ncbi:19077_t:CDS:2 [Gigaspora margarita]|uniref:Mitochondrial ribosomal protein mrp49 n=2 Tax=Gigaspora margarita TaxID=4874 RepID=A0A8H3X7Q4_GIGMA|nr:mitochondrial ribosomal protein mrp49 [Gigaspora margarita]CAG8518922.1 19077_t:CDS:2 [Gigaspora margarita]
MASTAKKLATLSKTAKLIIDLRTGLGAAKLDSNVKKVSLVFSRKQDNAGARYFLRENLPRIAFNNPDLNIEVSISKEYGVKPILTVEFERNDKKEVIIQLSKRYSDDICREFLDVTKATPAMLIQKDPSV